MTLVSRMVLVWGYPGLPVARNGIQGSEGIERPV